MKITYSRSLTDREWEIIEPLLPKKKNKTSNLDVCIHGQQHRAGQLRAANGERSSKNYFGSSIQYKPLINQLNTEMQNSTADTIIVSSEYLSAFPILLSRFYNSSIPLKELKLLFFNSIKDYFNKITSNVKYF